MKKSYLAYQIIFGVVVAVSFAVGVGMNPGFEIFGFFEGLCVEIAGWVLGVTIFQIYYDKKLAARGDSSRRDDPAPSTADELLKLKTLLDGGAITKEEFAALKGKLLESK